MTRATHNVLYKNKRNIQSVLILNWIQCIIWYCGQLHTFIWLRNFYNYNIRKNHNCNDSLHYIIYTHTLWLPSSGKWRNNEFKKDSILEYLNFGWPFMLIWAHLLPYSPIYGLVNCETVFRSTALVHAGD